MGSESRHRLVWVSVYAVAMGWFEAALVVYLRMLYMPEGFGFPLPPFPQEIAAIELGREAATLLMLLAVGMLAGRTPLECFGWFMFSFGVWDIMYYVGLKVALGWPSSLLEWDLLFLLPVPWIGPVLAPVLVSVGLIAACLVIVWQQDRGRPLQPSLPFWIGEVLCGLIIIGSFVIDYPKAFEPGALERFRWEIFLAGYLGGLGLFGWVWWKAGRS